MPQKDKLEFFVQLIFEKKPSLSKQDILSKAQSADLAADVVIFFKQLPDQNYNESSLIKELNNVIQQRGREDAVGGMLRQLAKAK